MLNNCGNVSNCKNRLFAAYFWRDFKSTSHTFHAKYLPALPMINPRKET